MCTLVAYENTRVRTLISPFRLILNSPVFEIGSYVHMNQLEDMNRWCLSRLEFSNAGG